MPHPLFRSIKNRHTAEVCSDMFRGSGEYLHIFSQEVGYRCDPTELAFDEGELLSVQAVYLRGRRRRLRVVTDFVLLTTSIDQDDLPSISALYENSVGKHQSFFAGTGVLDSFREWYTDMCISNDKRLLAAHLLMHPSGENFLIDSVVVPRVVAEETALHLRDCIIEVLPDKDEGIRDRVKPALQNPEHPALIELAGASGASNFLYTPDEFQIRLMERMSG